MKFNPYIILSLFALVLVTSCDDRLELEPAQSLSDEVALSTEENVKAVLLGAYDQLSDGKLWGGDARRDAELVGADGEISWVGTFNGPREIYNHAMITTNPDAEGLWQAGYAAINTSNNVLSALSVVNADDRGQVEGEALFVRAASYFELVRFFAKPYEAGGNNTQPGIPLVLTPTKTIDESSKVSRASVEAVYAQIIADLTKANAQLPASNPGYASKYAAAGLLARVYLQMGNYPQARSFADAVISSNNYKLNSSIDACFNNDEDTEEDIFSIQVSNQDGDNNLVIYYSVPAFGGRDGDIEINQKHLDLYTAGDARLDFHYDGNGATRTTKWRNQYRNMPVIRLAEMYLIRAECKVRNGENADSDYNATHTRAGLSAKSNVTLADVLLERRLELAHEGHRIHDVKRLKGSVDGLDYNNNKLVYPIPKREIDANNNLGQNDGY